MKNIMLIISLFTLMIACNNVSVEPVDMASIEGTVSIGPLCGNIMADAPPGNPCGLSNEAMDQIYAQYKVIISGYNSGKTTNKELVLNRTGKFTLEVPIGNYSVAVILPDGKTQNTFNAKDDLKKNLTVTKNQVAKIELFVNTGIL